MAVKRVTYFEIDVEDRQGVLSAFAGSLKKAKVNLRALWAFGIGGGRAKILCVPQNEKKLEAALRDGGHAARRGTAFHAGGPDKVGALTSALAAISAAGVSLHAAEAQAIAGKFGVYIWPMEADVDAVGRVLKA